MKQLKPAKEKFNLGKWLYEKLLLLVALVFEVAALLIDKGVVTGTEALEMRLTWIGIVIMLVYLVWNGLKQKYRYYSKKWGMGPYAEADPEDGDTNEKSDP